MEQKSKIIKMQRIVSNWERGFGLRSEPFYLFPLMGDVKGTEQSAKLYLLLNGFLFLYKQREMGFIIIIDNNDIIRFV